MDRRVYETIGKQSHLTSMHWPQGRINRYAKYAMAWGLPRQGSPWRPKLLFHTSICLVTVTLFARCFPKISHLFVSRFSWCRPILHSSLDRTLGRPILLLKLIVGLNKRKRLWQPFYTAEEHRGFPTNIDIGKNSIPPFLGESYAAADRTLHNAAQ